MNDQLVEKGWVKVNKMLDGLKVDQLQFLNSPALRRYITLPLEKNDRQVKVQQESLRHVSLPKTQIKILEIGGGIGNFAEHMFQNFDIGSYTMVDTPTMLRLSQAFLKERANKCTFVTTDKYHEVKKWKFDLAVSCSCLSEIPEKHRKYLLKLALKTSTATFLVDNSDLEFAQWVSKEMEAVYKNVLKIPYDFNNDQSQQIYIGMNNEL